MISQTSDRTLKQKSDIDKWIKSGAKGYFEWCTQLLVFSELSLW